MKYIKYLDGSWRLDEYFLYLDSLEGKVSPSALEFAKKKNHYDLRSHESLHDAWLQELKLFESAEGERFEIRIVNVYSRYLGPYHDLEFSLNYLGVVGFHIQGQNLSNGHGDVLMHEMCMEGVDLMSHELLFSTGSTIKIVFRGFQHECRVIDERLPS